MDLAAGFLLTPNVCSFVLQVLSVCTSEFAANDARQTHGIPVSKDHQW